MFAHVKSIIAAIAISLSAAPAIAHGDIRLVGTITAQSDQNVEIKTQDGETVNVVVGARTQISRDKTAVSASEIKVGDSVVVDVLDDHGSDLRAKTIRIVPPLPTSKK